RVSGNKLAVLYQGDIEPGTILQNSDIYDPAFQNMMICQTVNIDSIFIVGADSTAPCGQSELPLAINNFDGQNGNISVYPNPATDLINLSMNLNAASSVVSFELVDMTGKVVMTETRKNISTLNRQININGLANGTYLLKVQTDKGVYTEKVVKH
ncbi:MAG: T9SS type A sorting domain-containing protein, partial [Chitinophagaceae bacterium]